MLRGGVVRCYVWRDGEVWCRGNGDAVVSVWHSWCGGGCGVVVVGSGWFD